MASAIGFRLSYRGEDSMISPLSRNCLYTACPSSVSWSVTGSGTGAWAADTTVRISRITIPDPCLTSLGELIFLSPYSQGLRTDNWPLRRHVNWQRAAIFGFRGRPLRPPASNNGASHYDAFAFAVSAFALSACTFACALRCAASRFSFALCN